MAADRECLERARLEGEQCFCGNITDVVDRSLLVILSDCELLATLLDIRAVRYKHLTRAHCLRGMGIYCNEYVKFYQQAELFYNIALDRQAATLSSQFEAKPMVHEAAAVTEAAQCGGEKEEDDLSMPTENIFTSAPGDNARSDDKELPMLPEVAPLTPYRSKRLMLQYIKLSEM